MKCPKCSYIGFEATDRCRNCGYDFALATEAPAPPELALRSGTVDGPLTDLALRATPGAPAAPRAPGAKAPLDLDRVIGEPAAADLPLFQLCDAVEVLNGANTEPENELAYRVAKVMNKPGTGGSDAHSMRLVDHPFFESLAIRDP